MAFRRPVDVPFFRIELCHRRSTKLHREWNMTQPHNPPVEIQLGTEMAAILVGAFGHHFSAKVYCRSRTTCLHVLQGVRTLQLYHTPSLSRVARR